MTTLENITGNINITEKEQLVLNFLYEELEGNFGEEYSHIDVMDISEFLKMDQKSVKGIVGSLVKKDILGTYETGESNFGKDKSYDVIYFIGQGEFEYGESEEVKEPIKVGVYGHLNEEGDKVNKKELPFYQELLGKTKERSGNQTMKQLVIELVDSNPELGPKDLSEKFNLPNPIYVGKIRKAYLETE